MQGEFSQDTNPFIWVALNAGGLTDATSPQTPGYYFVEYVYELSNPLGSGAVYQREFVTELPTTNLPRACSAVTLAASTQLQPGTVLVANDGAWYQAGDKITDLAVPSAVFSFREAASPEAAAAARLVAPAGLHASTEPLGE